jgi:hypothetical protein
MDASSLTPDGPLPNDVPTLQALLRQLLTEMAQLRADNAELRTKLDAALKHRFGRRSERCRTLPLDKKDKPGKATPHGRSPLPEHLERREIVYDLTEAEKLCPCCRANASNLPQLRSAGQCFGEEFGVQCRRFAFAGNAVFPRMLLEQR